jgi:hypothetical protein
MLGFGGGTAGILVVVGTALICGGTVVGGFITVSLIIIF